MVPKTLNSKFPRSEKLRSEKEIQKIFKKGERINTFPFRLLYSSETSESLPKILISVPKRKFKRAVDRNLLKRKIREAYRLQKTILFTNSHYPKTIVIVYISDELTEFDFIQKKLKTGLERLIKKFESKNE